MGHPPAALTSRECPEKGCLQMKLGELGCQGVRDGKLPEVAGTPPPRGRNALPGF